MDTLCGKKTDYTPGSVDTLCGKKTDSFQLFCLKKTCSVDTLCGKKTDSLNSRICGHLVCEED